MGFRQIKLWTIPFLCIILTACGWNDLDNNTTGPSKILLLTMGGTKSHKIPFLALAKGLIAKGHEVTLLSGYEPDFQFKGLEEIAPKKLVEVVKNYEEYDYLGTRIRNELAKNIKDGLNFALQTCRALVTDSAVKDLLTRKFDLVIIDSYYAECALGLIPILKAPFMYLNTMTNFLNNIAIGGSPAPWSISPAFPLPYTDKMSLFQRIKNAYFMTFLEGLQRYVSFHIHGILKQNLRGHVIPHPLEVAKNVSFILQNGHPTVSANSPFLPNVAHIGGIHCKPARQLPTHLKDYLDGAGENGFIYVSWGTSVNPKTLPTEMLKIILTAFSQLPYRIIWKFVEDFHGLELPANVRTEKWLPQQDILGHKNIKAFVTHSGMFGTLETIYHGVPVVTLPVFADQESNAAKVVMEGFGVKLEVKELSVDKLVNAINEVAANPKYKTAAKRSQRVLKDQANSPLDTAVYWTEYVIRHQGAKHFQSPARNLYWFQYYSYDILLILILCIALGRYSYRLSRKYTIRVQSGIGKKKM